MEILKKPIAELLADPANVRIHSDANLEAIKGPLLRDGDLAGVLRCSSQAMGAGDGPKGRIGTKRTILKGEMMQEYLKEFPNERAEAPRPHLAISMLKEIIARKERIIVAMEQHAYRYKSRLRDEAALTAFGAACHGRYVNHDSTLVPEGLAWEKADAFMDERKKRKDAQKETQDKFITAMKETFEGGEDESV